MIHLAAAIRDQPPRRVEEINGLGTLRLLEACREAGVDLRSEGVTIAPERENSEYGRFAWVIDPEGNRIELWEPPKGQ